MSSDEPKTSKPVRTTNGVLLTTADRQIEALIEGARSIETLTDSLYEAVLFHQGVVVPDIFAFISTAIAEQRFLSEKTDLEHVLESGLATPAFRSGTDSFESALKRIQDQGILGLTENPKAIAVRLDRARQTSKVDLRHIPWSSSTSTKYGECIISALSEIVDKQAQSAESAKYLDLTRAFLVKHRFPDLVLEQLAKGGGELRRGFLFQTALDILNSIHDSGKPIFTDARDLLHHPACSKDQTISAGVQSIVCLSNLIYQRNMANDFNANCYLAGRAYPKAVHHVVSVAIRNSLPSTGVKTMDFTPQEDEHITFRVTIPSMRQLEAVGMKRLLEIRAAHTEGYFSLLHSWQGGSGSVDDVERSLKEYSKALVLAVNSDATFVDVALSRFAKSERTGIQSAARLAIDVLSADNPLIKSFSAGLGPIANVTYSWFTQRPIEISFARRPNVVV